MGAFLEYWAQCCFGRSFTQYFLGEFDGTAFTSDDNYLRKADLGKDWYAAQTRYNFPDGEEAYGIGWASNWQYCNRVPAERYRSDMSLPRKFSLSLISRPIDLSIARLPSDDMAMIICKRLTGVDLPCLNR